MHYLHQYRGYTPELIASCRLRYEETDEPVAAIIVDLDVRPASFYRMIRRWGWKLRRERNVQDISPARWLLIEAEAALQAASEDFMPTESGMGAGTAPDSAAVQSTQTAPTPVAQRLERAVEKELRAVEIMRATLGTRPQLPVDGERTARTLAILAETLAKVRRLRLPEPQAAEINDNYDMPRDFDEFRRALTLRIETFVRSRSDRSLFESGESSGADSTRQ
ncbi:MAG: hypothetical protein QOF19_287 [Alphaproteobacteria bacterium]|jgi:hypothetical protein|nr:hypothetical protein [Alphaproteobacteria bacterium]